MIDESDWAAMDPAGYWESKYEEAKARLAELVELLKVNPNAYASDILDAWTPAQESEND